MYSSYESFFLSASSPLEAPFPLARTMLRETSTEVERMALSAVRGMEAEVMPLGAATVSWRISIREDLRKKKSHHERHIIVKTDTPIGPASYLRNSLFHTDGLPSKSWPQEVNIQKQKKHTAKTAV